MAISKRYPQSQGTSEATATIVNAISYSCPGCGGALSYRPAPKGKEKIIHCNKCNVDYSMDSLKELKNVRGMGQFHWGDYKKAYEQQLQRMENVKVYTCGSCGATLETDAATAASQCPYCLNPVILNDRLSGGIRPNGIIPFKIQQDGVEQAIRDYYQGKKLLPYKFAVRNMIRKVRAVYVPFWLFDATVEGPLIYEATKSHSTTSGNYDYSETEHWQIVANGKMVFSCVPVDGSKKMDNDVMDAVCPYNFQELVEFNPGYLSGYLADRFDEEPDESLPRVSGRMQEYASSSIKGIVTGGYESPVTKLNGIDIKSADVKYVLLPVYTALIRYMGKDYRFAINGQTGKVVGDLPISWAKKSLSYLGPLCAGMAAWIGLIYWFFC